MNKTFKSSLFGIALMAMLLACEFDANAAGLGRLSVFSGIGQQLNAEIALTATPAELAGMTARLASPEAFREAGIEYQAALAGVRISVEKNAAGAPVLKLTSVDAISEPFLHFLVELDWTAGRMIREYTFLLDPPEMLQAAKPASVVAPATPAAQVLPPAAVAVAAATAPAGVQAKSATTEYQVKPGDTLSKIAQAIRPASVSLNQMLVALFNRNPEAFIGHNMNRLRAGSILAVPAADEAGQVEPRQARQLVMAQAGEFAAYRRRLAEMAARAPAAEAPVRQAAQGTIKPTVEEKAPAPAASDKLVVSRTEPAQSAPAQAGGNLEADLLAREKALREASERIAQLEKNIENLKQLVEIKSQEGAKLQAESQAARGQPAAPAIPAASQPTVKEEVATPAAATPPEAAPVAPPPAAKRPVPPPAPAAPEPSFFEENPQLVYGGGGVVALLLAYLAYVLNRRKKAQIAAAELSSAAAEPVSESSSVQLTGLPPASDVGEISIQGDFSEGGLLTNEEIVDPVAEADVLMAYGRDRQAEEILQEGLRKDPARQAIHMKLLELYAKLENPGQFEATARVLYDLCHGRGADWEKAVGMARTLGLGGGIFATGLATAADFVEPTTTVGEPAAAVEPAVTAEPEEAAPAAEVGAGGTAAAFAAQPVSEAETATSDTLDFDLDLGTTSDVAKAAAAAVSASSAAEEAGLDFDFELETPAAKEAVEAAVGAGDLDLDLGSPGPLAQAAASPLAEVATPAAEEPATAETEITPASFGMNDMEFDFDLELDADTGTSAAAATPATLAATPLAEPTLPPVPPVAADDLLLGVSPADQSKPDSPEVATKLELAQAYEEMGDIEGARELLSEVLNEGSESQRAQAQIALDRLSA